MFELIVTVYLLLPNGQTLVDRQPPRLQATEAACQAAAAAATAAATAAGLRAHAWCGARHTPTTTDRKERP